MDYFDDVLISFLGLEHGSCFAVYAVSEWKLSDLIKNVLVCVPNLNEDLTGWKRHKGD